MVKVALLAILVGQVACLDPSAVTCGDGRTCPAGSICDDTRSLCLTEAQTTACKGIVNGRPCKAETRGICDRGFCEPGCGDGHTDPDEQCDDGNFASHDGCSSRCVVEVPTWVEQTIQWRGLTYPAAVYHAALGRIVVFGGANADGHSDAIWQIDPSKIDEPEGGWREVTGAFAPTERPSKRRAMGIAYDPLRQVVVIHGGDGPDAVNFDETWEYAIPPGGPSSYQGEPVGAWRRVTTASSPGALFDPAMAFDAALGKVVLIGGQKNGATQDGTWTYDGTDWAKVPITVVPNLPPRPNLAFDDKRQVLMTFGRDPSSFVFTTYEFTGTDWVASALTPSPKYRQGAMMTYDPGRQKIVLFGGYQGSAVYSDTWTYDSAWQQLGVPANPPGRRTAQLVGDPVNNSTWLFGGSLVNGTDPFEDQWQLTGAGWTDRTPRFVPPGASNPAAAYSRDAASVLLVGGEVYPRPPNHEVWAHDGTWRRHGQAPVSFWENSIGYDPDHRRFVVTGGACSPFVAPDCDNDGTDTYAVDIDSWTWTKLAATWPSTSAHVGIGWVYDRPGQRFVAYGGSTSEGVAGHQTWVSDGTALTELVTAEHPGDAGGANMTFDPELGAPIVFDQGGDTWQLLDGQWTKLVAASDGSTPPARYSAVMTYDPARKRHVLVGGISSASQLLLTDVWELDTNTATWSQLYVPGPSPLPRFEFVLAKNDNLRGLVFSGGAAGSLFAKSDTWLLKFLSDTPDEACTNGEDDDLDTLTDVEDPDCDPLP